MRATERTLSDAFPRTHATCSVRSQKELGILLSVDGSKSFNRNSQAMAGGNARIHTSDVGAVVIEYIRAMSAVHSTRFSQLWNYTT